MAAFNGVSTAGTLEARAGDLFWCGQNSERDRPVLQGLVDDLFSRCILEAVQGMEDKAGDCGVEHVRSEKYQAVVDLRVDCKDPADDFDELVPCDVRDRGRAGRAASLAKSSRSLLRQYSVKA